MFRRPLLFAVPLLALLMAAGCADAGRDAPAGPHADAARGHNPWIFRSVLDWRPRMVTVALREDLWVAYDAANASLYKVWQGGVDFDGPVYTQRHGPQPVSQGAAYLVSPYREPWRVRQNGTDQTPTVSYIGHDYAAGRAELRYELVLGDGTRVRIAESPEVVEDGGPGLERVFTTEGMPTGTEVALHVHLNSLRAADSYETDGTFAAGPSPAGPGTGAEGWLTLNANGTTHLTARFGAPAIAPVDEDDDDEALHPGLALINESDCQTCHNAEEQTVGPAYLAIAARYEDNDAVMTELANKVQRGGAGVWGEVMMSPHPNLSLDDAKTMIAYILSLDDDANTSAAVLNIAEGVDLFDEDPALSGGQGAAVNVYRTGTWFTHFPLLDEAIKPVKAHAVSVLHALSSDDFDGADYPFYLEAFGALQAPTTGEYTFRLVSADGSELYIADERVIENGGIRNFPAAVEGTTTLRAGPHRFKIRYFQGWGPMALSFQWKKPGDADFSVVPAAAMTHDAADLRETGPFTPPQPDPTLAPGDGLILDAVHPSFTLETIRPDGFEPMVGGLGFMSDGSLIVSTWDPAGSVYRLTNLDGPRSDIAVTRIATGLAEPLGLAVVEDTVYIMQKQELTRLVDDDGDGLTDRFETVSDDWGATTNFHEFGFGLVYEDGYFYATLATAIDPGGASTQPQNPDRGKVLKISRDGSSRAFIASGLRTPNGIGYGVGGHLYVADNQGDWLPSSKIVRVDEGAWYGSRSVDFEGTEGLTQTPPVVWLPQDEIGNSPSTPAPLDVGPYTGQMIHGEVTHGGLKRVFVEEVDGQPQGVVFRFTQGLEAGVNRILWGPDGKLYIGEIGNPGNWGDHGKQWYGLQRLTYNETPTFEMLAVRARADGFEIAFTEPLAAGITPTADDVLIKQWYYQPTANYGGPKLDERTLPAKTLTLSPDRTKLFVGLDGLKDNHMVYFRLRKPAFRSEGGRALWTTEAWYTLNRVPSAAGATFAAR